MSYIQMVDNQSEGRSRVVASAAEEGTKKDGESNVSYSEASPFLPSVKSWNQHIRPNNYMVKDHTAVPYAALQDKGTWKGNPGQFSLQNYSQTFPNETQRQCFGGTAVAEPVSDVNDNQSAAFKKAFDMASRTRDMLNKLDGWRDLSLKLLPAATSKTTTSNTCMIKSSSQYTTLDAKSDEAKNILQNIKDMAQLLCPAEQGGISHFRMLRDGNASGHNSGIQKPYQKVETAEDNYWGNYNTETVNHNISIGNNEVNMNIGPYNKPSTTHQVHPATSALSRINFIGAPSSQTVDKFFQPNKQLEASGMQDAAGNVTMKSANQNVQDLSKVLESYIGNEFSKKDRFTQAKSVFEEMMAKLRPSVLRQTSTEKCVEHQIRPSDNYRKVIPISEETLYEDFEDNIPRSYFEPSHGFNNSKSFSSEIHGNPHFKNVRSYQANVRSRADFMTSERKKDQMRWEQDTQDFLKKLQRKQTEERIDSPDLRDDQSQNPSFKLQARISTNRERSSMSERDRSRQKTPLARDLTMPTQRRSSDDTRTSNIPKKEIKKTNDVNVVRVEKCQKSYGKRQEDGKFGAGESKNNIVVSGGKRSRHTDSDQIPNKHTVKSSQNYLFCDDGSHQCKKCNMSGLTLSSYLDHLLTPEHVKTMSDDLPNSWKFSKFDETSLDTKSKDNRFLPIRGTDCLHPVTTGFYCRACDKYYPDKNSILHHLTTKRHDEETHFYKKAKAKKRSLELKTLPVPSKRSKLEDAGAITTSDSGKTNVSTPNGSSENKGAKLDKPNMSGPVGVNPENQSKSDNKKNDESNIKSTTVVFPNRPAVRLYRNRSTLIRSSVKGEKSKTTKEINKNLKENNLRAPMATSKNPINTTKKSQQGTKTSAVVASAHKSKPTTADTNMKTDKGHVETGEARKNPPSEPQLDKEEETRSQTGLDAMHAQMVTLDEVSENDLLIEVDEWNEDE